MKYILLVSFLCILALRAVSLTTGVSILSRTYFLRYRIIRYYYMKHENTGLARSDVNCVDDLDIICQNAHASANVCIFTGLSISATMFAFYMLDMATGLFIIYCFIACIFVYSHLRHILVLHYL